MNLAEATEYGVHFKTGTPVVVHFVRNTAKAPPAPAGDPYQQRIEPAGRYMIHNPEPGDLPEGWVQGTVRFQSPLVLAFNTDQGRYYDDGSWKKQLERFFHKRGRALSRAVFVAGYDGIVTVMPGTGDTREIVDLTWLRLQP